MGKIVIKGQLLFGIAVAALGVENLFCAHFGLTDPGVPWFPVNPFFGYINGIALSAAGLSIAAKLHSRLTAILLGYLFGGYVLFLELPLVVAHPADWTVYGVFFEALALGASAWTLVQTLPRASSRFKIKLHEHEIQGFTERKPLRIKLADALRDAAKIVHLEK